MQLAIREKKKWANITAKKVLLADNIEPKVPLVLERPI